MDGEMELKSPQQPLRLSRLVTAKSRLNRESLHDPIPLLLLSLHLGGCDSVRAKHSRIQGRRERIFLGTNQSQDRNKKLSGAHKGDTLLQM